MKSGTAKRVFCVSITCTLVLILLWLKPSLSQEKEKTYSISLVKTAEAEQEVYEVDDKKVLTQTFTVQKGDWIWKILRKEGLLKRGNLAELISVL
ncbi:MAG: hypothetical protein JRJ69_12880, partial [Deltaproteobacteria bacterium]|nr:hypothetical protein [Deltaproteobacteria bacterium]